jgi:LacI family transcriptional regulator
MPVPHHPRVAILVETSTTWARSILGGINRHLRKGTYWHLFIEPHGSNESIRMPSGWQGEGVIADIKDETMARHLHALDIPVVNISQITFPGMPFPTVTSDIQACHRMAVNYYRQRGFENLAYLRLQRSDFDRLHAGSFAQLVREAGANFYEFGVKKRAWGVADWNLSVGELAAWLKGLPKPVGIFSWAIGREVVHACHLAGLKIPEDVALLMLSDDEVFLEMSHIPMSGITHPGAEIGAKAAAMLDLLMQGRKPRQPVIKIAPPDIKTRQSSDVLAIADPALRTALGYIRQHASQPLQVEAVAQHAGVSRRSLEQRFSKTLGRSPAEFIRDSHMERAQELLRETTLPIPDVASAAGFSSPEYMAQLFRARLKISPLRYRKKVTAR